MKANWYIDVFGEGTYEFQTLDTVAQMLNFATGKNARNGYAVDVTYFDYGQDWPWTTILCNNSAWGRVQVLSPRQQEEILTAVDLGDLVKVVNEILKKEA